MHVVTKCDALHAMALYEIALDQHGYVPTGEAIESGAWCVPGAADSGDRV